MRRRLLLATAMAAVAFGPLPATAQGRPDFARMLDNTLRAYTVLILRSMVDFTYETFESSLETGETVITGLTVTPRVPWDTSGACVITMGRAVLSGTVETDGLSSLIEATGLNVPPACLEPEAAGFLAQLGYEGVQAETAVIEIGYNLPSSAASLSVQAGLAEAVDLNLTADFAYFWFTGLLEEAMAPPDDSFNDSGTELPPMEMPMSAGPVPSILLRSAQISIDNRGLWDKVEPMVAQTVGSVEALPEMLRGALEQELAEGGTRQLSQAEQDFSASLAAAVDRFVKERSRLTVSVSPPSPVWLNEALFETPDTLIGALQPMVSTDSHRAVAMVAPATVKAAMAAAPEVSVADRLAAGRALMSGVGAPRDRAAALKILQPLADAGDADAALVIAEGLADQGDAVAAYPYALRAMGGGMIAAIALGDRLEADLPPKAIREAQAQVLTGWSGDPGLASNRAGLLAAPSVSAMRKLALDLMIGRGVPRNYEQAYLWATLAAAAGDRSAANLRNGLDRMARGGVWAEAFDAAAATALTVWSDEGLGQKLFEMTSAR
jgi:hypothetical protein